MMQPQSPYIRYRASRELDQLVQNYIAQMESPQPRPNEQMLLEIMERFVNESVDTFVSQPAAQLQLRPTFLKMIESLVSLVRKSSMMLVTKVAKKMSLEDHRNAAHYMKSVRMPLEEANGEVCGYIAFPIHADQARLGWETRDRMLNGSAKDPAALKDGVRFLHSVIDVANLWIFEQPMEILKLGAIMRTLALTTVSTVKKATHSLIDTLVPKISEEQVRTAANYFSDIVGPGPYHLNYGEIPAEFLNR